MIDKTSLRGGLGLAALAAIASTTTAQLAQQAVQPTEQITFSPVTFSWSELLELQAATPRLPVTIDIDQFSTIEVPAQDIPAEPGTYVRRHEMDGGDVQRLGPCASFGVEPPIGAAFDSQLDVPDGAGFSFIPPDIGGGVGPRHLMTMLNNQTLITNRSGGAPVAIDTNVFWAPAGATPLSPTIIYPRVYFNAHINRWVASARNGITSTGSTTIVIALSHSDDPTGMWDYYTILADPGATSFADWTLLGYNVNWITITSNMFSTPSGASFLGAKMWTIDATSLPPGGPITVSVFPAGFLTTAHGSGGSSPHPARTFDGDPTLWMINNGFTSSGNYLFQLTQITGTGPSPVVSGLAGSPFGGSTSFCFVTTNFSATSRTMSQVGDVRFINAFSNRIASVAVRNGKIWVANAAGTPGPSSNAAPTAQSVLWHQLDPTLPFPGAPAAPGSMMVQSGAISNGANTMCMYPSLAVNCGDDVLIGYANGDATISPRACYSIRLGTAPLNAMGPINELKAGESVYWKNFGVGTTAQYGRYTAAAVDPNDDHTLWTLQEYADQRVATPGVDNDSRWGTHWGRFGDCTDLPEITDEPDPVVGCVGDPVSFTVVVSSPQPVTYQWRKNGVDIMGETSDTLSIASTVAGDAGTYDVVVCGCGQVISAPATLSFAGAMITLQPVSVVVAHGGMASFSVAGVGQGTITYQWLFNGSPIPLANSSTYSIAMTTAADYGKYECIVADDCGPALSDPAFLRSPIFNHKSQADLSFHIFESPKSTTGCVGGQVVLSVTAYPAGLTYSWRKNGVPIMPAETGSSLTIDPVSVADAGSYDVVVSLGMQSKTSSAATLTVHDVPTILVQPSPTSQTVGVGSTVIYSVTATGDGPISYQWRFRPNGQGTTYSDIPGATGPTLELNNVSVGESGRYRCVVTNPCGNVLTDVLRLIVI